MGLLHTAEERRRKQLLAKKTLTWPEIWELQEIQAIEERLRRERKVKRTESHVHSYQRHGREAEELRAGIEKMIKDPPSADHPEAQVLVGSLVDALQDLLDQVDARDSLAYLERKRTRGRSRAITSRSRRR